MIGIAAFYISEVAADWHEVMIPQRIVRWIAAAFYCSKFGTHDAACRHSRPQKATRGLRPFLSP